MQVGDEQERWAEQEKQAERASGGSDAGEAAASWGAGHMFLC